MDAYLLVIQLANGNCYLELSEDNRIAAWTNMNLITERFESFYERSQSSDYETHMSACWGILSFRPFVIKAPGDRIDWLEPLVLDARVQKITGGNVRIENPMLHVDPKILELSILDICKNVIDTLYGRDV